MNEELQQNVVAVFEKTVKAVSAFLVGGGLGTIFDWIPDVLGCISIIVGLWIAIHFKKRKDHLYDLYEKKLDEKEKAHE